MKEIIGKIKFVAIPVNKDVKIIDYGKTNLLRNSEDVDFIANKVTINQIKTAVYLSDITEEQAAELVDGCEDGFGNYLNAQLKWFDSAKESLISLLKANDCLTKKMVKDVKFILSKPSTNEMEPMIYKNGKSTKISDLPDDFLIIKL